MKNYNIVLFLILELIYDGKNNHKNRDVLFKHLKSNS